ncbi:MAG TPA: TNT domain-containing protein [Rhodopila sp.]|jgi:hypothetical protein|nr:TNT domain-containing protein [Rhodopila sp.]
MKQFAGPLFIATALLALTPLPPALGQTATATQVAAAAAPPSGFPANLRWDLVPKWIQWANAKAAVDWPPHDGCASAPVTRSLAPGALIDRFGSEGGTFFSPKGESFAARAVPYVCRQMDYRVYRVLKPLSVQSCNAAPWFGEPGGAPQVQTADPAYKLVADGSLQVVSYAVGGHGGPAPQCERP